MCIRDRYSGEMLFSPDLGSSVSMDGPGRSTFSRWQIIYTFRTSDDNVIQLSGFIYGCDCHQEKWKHCFYQFSLCYFNNHITRYSMVINLLYNKFTYPIKSVYTFVAFDQESLCSTNNLILVNPQLKLLETINKQTGRNLKFTIVQSLWRCKPFS